MTYELNPMDLAMQRVALDQGRLDARCESLGLDYDDYMAICAYHTYNIGSLFGAVMSASELLESLKGDSLLRADFEGEVETSPTPDFFKVVLRMADEPDYGNKIRDIYETEIQDALSVENS